MQYSSLTDALDHLSGLDRSIRLVDRGGEAGVLSFAELRARALNLLHVLQSRGIERGDELMVVVNRNDAFLDAFWACLYGGIVPVPLAPGVTDEQRRKIFRVADTLSRPALFTEHALSGRLGKFARDNGLSGPHRRIRDRTIALEDVVETGCAPSGERRGPDDTAFIQFSSGSTSDPKGVVLTHGNLLANIRDMIETAGLSDSDRGLSWMPLTHDMGLIGFHLMMVLAGMEHTIIATDAFIRRPMRWIRGASDYRANVLCSPNFGYRYLLKSFSPDKAGDIDLSHVRIIFNGAEPISATLCEEFLDAMAPYGLPRTAMYPVYGLAEASLAVSFPAVETLYETITVNRASLGYGDAVDLDAAGNPVTLVCVGRAIGECEVRIGDDEANDLGPDRVGRVLIRGPNVTRGFYVDGESLNTEAFRGGEWLDTGDLGFFHEGGLYITGRTKDVIFVNGQNFYAHDIEAVAAQAEGLELGKVAAAGATNPKTGVDELILFIVFRGEQEAFGQLARRAAAMVGEHTGAPVSVAVAVQSIPKTTSGKLRRFSMQNDYEAGVYTTTALRLSGSAEAQHGGDGGTAGAESFLRELCNELLEGIRIGRDDSFFDLGVSSLKMIEIHERIDERYPDRIEVTDLFDYPTLAKLAARLEEDAG